MENKTVLEPTIVKTTWMDQKKKKEAEKQETE